eukprot:Amastigsp_a508493_631.p1 type:complete len:319 gc:universal Amastigsp_a508493_631:1036-80(-)
MSSRIIAETQERKPADTVFKQQRLPAWKPVMTPKAVVTIFLFVGFLFFPLGVLFLTASNAVKQTEIDYSGCVPSPSRNVTNNCTAVLSLPSMKAPVYIYYQLTSYHQNHRRYVKSRNDAQLNGKPPSTWGAIEDCLPRRAVNEDKDKSNRGNWFLPCGLIAYTAFNDSFEILPPASSSPLPWRKTGVAWESDVEKKFRNPAPTAVGTRLTPAVDFTDEDFIVWMRTSGLPAFRKLYRVIDTDIPAGTYTLQISSKFPVSEFGGTKSLVISTVGWMGGKNSFLGTAYIVVGVLSVLIGFVLLLLNVLFKRPSAYVADRT